MFYSFFSLPRVEEARLVYQNVEQNAFETKELSGEDVHFLFVNDEVRLRWPDWCDADTELV